MIRHGVSAGGNFHALMGQNRQLIHSHTSAMTIPRLQLRLCVFVGVRRYFPAGNPSFSISRDGCFISALVAAAVDQGSVRQLRTVAGIHSSGSSPAVKMTTPGWLNATTCQMLHPGFGEKVCRSRF